jgi:predicted glycogen debranching enzyme
MDSQTHSTDAAPPLTDSLAIPCSDLPLESLLGTEWLIANRLGAYASSSVAGCNTRRYHGLLVAASNPPVGRLVALSNVVEQIVLDGVAHDVATNEFDGAFSPHGHKHLTRFDQDVIPRFTFHVADGRLTKEILLAESANAVAIRYTWAGPACTLALRPLVALRNFHHTRRTSLDSQMTFHTAEGGVVVHDRSSLTHDLHLTSPEAIFQPDGQWWYDFRYRADDARGFGDREDLYCPGEFAWELQEGESCELLASLDEPGLVFFESALARRRERLARLVSAPGRDGDALTRHLARATDAYLVKRPFGDRPGGLSILAGFPWFADWGRDTFISLPGLLLCTQRFEQARQVFTTYAVAITDGLVPNRFDDDTTGAHYNSVDASLWFCVAAERYLQATGDERFFHDQLVPAMERILRAMHEGTHFGIHADSDGLLVAGDPTTQLTWMDAKSHGVAVTPRHGKAVEINALWYAAHQILAHRCDLRSPELAQECRDVAMRMAPAFVRTFWNAGRNCLNDCVNDDGISTAVRPNQIFAVSLPFSPLSDDQQRAVVNCVQRHLLTPFGLRTLSPEASDYCSRYEGGPDQRDHAYHQGTVWPWLLGPFVEAFLKVHPLDADTLRVADGFLDAFGEHIQSAGLGQVSEVFDADAPHRPAGCVAQAWSVAELLRAKMLIQQYRSNL